MTEKTKYLIDKLKESRSLHLSEYRELIEGYTKESASYAASLALSEKKRVYGDSVFIRGLIEITNI